MITWMTRISFFDTAADIDTNLLLQTADESAALFNAMVGMADAEDHQAGASAMWAGYEPAVAAYHIALTIELATRGIRGHSHLEIGQTVDQLRRVERADFEHPPWMEDTDVLRSHRSNLTRRWPKEYNSKWDGTPASWPYIWAFTDGNGGYDLMVSKAERAMLKTGERRLPKNVQARIENL